MLIGSVVLLIIVLVFIIALVLEAIRYGDVRGKKSLLDPMLRRSIEPTCELIWIQSFFFFEMAIIYNKQMIMYCDNQATIDIANNPSFMSR